MKPYTYVVCGGTFDLFHAGHKNFLRFVFSQGKKVLIGLTSNSYVNQNKMANVEPFSIRKKTLEEFIKEENAANFVEIVEIHDMFGPTLNPDTQFDALIVSEGSKKGAAIINEERKKRGLKELIPIIVPLLKVGNYIVSSSLIRAGIINREGREYGNIDFSSVLYLPQYLREELRQPFGEIVREIPVVDPSRTVTVGDVVTKMFNDKGVGQKISVVDLVVKRKRILNNISEHSFSSDVSVVNIKNEPATINPQLINAIKKAFESSLRSAILVEGEEDLSVLPILLFSPLGYSIFYGQPGTGMVCILVDEKVKEKAYTLVSKFDKNL